MLSSNSHPDYSLLSVHVEFYLFCKMNVDFFYKKKRQISRNVPKMTLINIQIALKTSNFNFSSKITLYSIFKPSLIKKIKKRKKFVLNFAAFKK